MANKPEWISVLTDPQKNGEYLGMYGSKRYTCGCGQKIDALKFGIVYFYRSDDSMFDLPRMPQKGWILREGVRDPSISFTSQVAFWQEIPRIGWHIKKNPTFNGWYLVLRDCGINPSSFKICLYLDGIWCWDGSPDIPFNDEVIKWRELPERLKYHAECDSSWRSNNYIFDKQDYEDED